MNYRAYIRSIRHTFAPGEVEQNLPYYGNFIAAVDLPGAVEISLADGSAMDLVQGFKINLPKGQEFEALRIRRTGTAAESLSIWIIVGWEPRGDEKPLFEDNRAIFDIGALSVNIAEQFASNLPTWTRRLPRVSGGVEAPGLGYASPLYAMLTMSALVQIAVKNPNAIERRIRITPVAEAGGGATEVVMGRLADAWLEVCDAAGRPIAEHIGARVRDYYRPPMGADLSPEWNIMSGQDIVIKGGDPLWARSVNWGPAMPELFYLRVEEVYRAKVPLA